DAVQSVHASDTAGPESADDDSPRASAQASAGGSTPAAASFTDSPPVVPAKLQGLDLGPACSQCGGMMQRTGSCYTCSSRGNNTGCGCASVGRQQASRPPPGRVTRGPRRSAALVGLRDLLRRRGRKAVLAGSNASTP